MKGQHIHLSGRMILSTTLLLSLASILPGQAQNGIGNQDSCEVIIPKEYYEEVQNWWDELEKKLNDYYTNDVGIKFEVRVSSLCITSYPL